jgi:hypothetical protein
MFLATSMVLILGLVYLALVGAVDPGRREPEDIGSDLQSDASASLSPEAKGRNAP